MTALEIAERYYAHFNKREWEGMLDLVAGSIRHEPNQADAPRIGKELFREFLEKMDTAYEETLTDMVFFTEPSGEKVAVEFMVNGIYKQGEAGFPAARGQRYVLPAGAFLTITDEKIARITTYYNLEEWIRLVS